MQYDVVIVGAGMSGLAAGIRLAYFGKRVCVVERHYAFGGLNSYYRRDGHDFDVGLHAVTNYVPAGVRVGPLPKLLRQLRMSREDLDLRPQRFSEIRFPEVTLRFSNDCRLLIEQVADRFPGEADNFRGLIDMIRSFDDTRLNGEFTSTRRVLREFIREPMLVEMLLCPLMYYGSATEHDMDLLSFVILFKSIYLEGFARPPGGVRTIIKALVRKFRELGGALRMRCGVEEIVAQGDRVMELRVSSGESLSADTVFSCAGYVETLRLCPALSTAAEQIKPGRVSFVEAIALLDQPPAAAGHEAAIVFFNDERAFTYAAPESPVDLRSGVICCPTNYEDHDTVTPALRVTWLARHDAWETESRDEYEAQKRALGDDLVRRGEQFVPGFRDHIVYHDIFTPRTIRHYTGHIHGAVYGAPEKRWDGRTPLKNLFICGTDQGYLGIIGAMMSGVTMANMHVLARE